MIERTCCPLADTLRIVSPSLGEHDVLAHRATRHRFEDPSAGAEHLLAILLRKPHEDVFAEYPMNMFPFTNAESWPNMGRMLTAGWSGTIDAKKSFVSSVGFGNLEGGTPAPYRGS